MASPTPGPVTIRPATEADQATIRRLIREANLNRMSLRWPTFVIAEVDGAVVGIGQVKTHGGGTSELASIAVVPGRQGEGIGSAIIKALLAREPDGVLYLTCRNTLQSYYERFDFRAIEPGDYPGYYRRLLPLVNLIAGRFGMRILLMRRDSVG
jgi:N-acetylglutamate synthase-like GNAT family acetyltransferase